MKAKVTDVDNVMDLDPPNRIQGVALDLDGLLYDTEPLYFLVGTELLNRRGKVFDATLQRKMMGRPGVEAIMQMVQHHALSDEPHALLAESNEIYAEMLKSDLAPMPGLTRLIEVLQQSKIPFGVATSSLRRHAETILRRDNLYECLTFLLTGEDVTRGKPHPEMYLQAAHRLSISPTNMLVLEDSENGCSAALAAGAITVAVPGIHSSEHRFDKVALRATSLTDPTLMRWLQHSAGGDP